MDQSTESRILEASKQVFIRKGFEGARMQEIANEAGINKALLHYYFRSKQKLFEAVFQEALAAMIPQINEIIESEASIFEKIQRFVEKYNEFLMKNPFLPIFVLSEVQRNPSNIANLILKSDGKIPQFLSQIKALVSTEAGDDIPVEHIFINILSLTIFPIVARPIFENVLFQGKTSAYNSFLNERPTHIKQLLEKALSTKTSTS